MYVHFCNIYSQSITFFSGSFIDELFMLLSVLFLNILHLITFDFDATTTSVTHTMGNIVTVPVSSVHPLKARASTIEKFV